MMNFRSLVSGAALILLLCSPGIVAASGPDVVSGKVLETMNAGGYSYLQVETSQGSVWAAIPETTIEKGQEVTVMPGAAMPNFTSKTLNRTFETIIFSSGLEKGGAPAGQMAEAGHGANPHGASAAEASGGSSFQDALRKEGGSAGHDPHGGHGAPSAQMGMQSTGSQGAIVPSADIKVEKAEGDNAYTVGELYDQSVDLDGKTVKVRGKIMKVSKMIMGKNWLHIQDGTGNALKNTHDLVVTTMAEPAKDAVVVVEGVLHANKDFGFGYKYNVIVEDAEVK